MGKDSSYGMQRIILWTFCLFLWGTGDALCESFKLTDRMYLTLREESEDFRQSDDKLNQVFKEILRKSTPEEKQELMKIQKNWLADMRNCYLDVCVNRRGKPLSWCAKEVTESRYKIYESYLNGTELSGFAYFRPDRDYANGVYYETRNSINISSNDSLMFDSVDVMIPEGNFDANYVWQLAEKNNTILKIIGKIAVSSSYTSRPRFLTSIDNNITISTSVNGMEYSASTLLFTDNYNNNTRTENKKNAVNANPTDPAKDAARNMMAKMLVKKQKEAVMCVAMLTYASMYCEDYLSINRYELLWMKAMTTYNTFLKEMFQGMVSEIGKELFGYTEIYKSCDSFMAQQENNFKQCLVNGQ